MNDLKLEMTRLRMALKFVVHDIKITDGDIVVTIKSDNKDDVIISSTFTSNGIYDIIDEIIFRKIDRLKINGKLERKQFLHQQDIGMSKHTQLELYGNYQIDNFDIYQRHIKLLDQSKEVDVDKLLRELSNESIVALNQEEVAPIKDILNIRGFSFETWRRENDTMIVISMEDSEILGEELDNNNIDIIKPQTSEELNLSDNLIKQEQKQEESMEVYVANNEQEVFNILKSVETKARTRESAEEAAEMSMAQLVKDNQSFAPTFNYLELNVDEIDDLIEEGLIEDIEYDFYDDHCYLKVLSLEGLTEVMNLLGNVVIYSSEEVNEIKMTHNEMDEIQFIQNLPEEIQLDLYNQLGRILKNR